MEDNKWQCAKGKQWFVVDELPDLTKPHEAWMCDGSCDSAFHKGVNLAEAYAVFMGVSWGELDQYWIDEELSKLSEAERKAHEAEKEAQLAREAAKKELESFSNLIANRVRQHEILANCKNNIGKKILRPCKWLYSCRGDRSTGGSKPTTLYVSSECWSHAYTDPETGKRVEKHVCWHLHPDEEGWCKEWNKNRNYVSPSESLAPTQVNRFAALGPSRPAQIQQRPAQYQQQKPIQQNRKPTNLFALLEDDE